HAEEPHGRDRPGDRSGDGFARTDERFVRIGAFGRVPAVETLDDAPHGTKEDPAFAVDVRAVLRDERRPERVRGTEADGPREGDVGRASIDVLLDGEAAIDPGSVDLASLFVQTPDGRSHALRTDTDDVHTAGERMPLVRE